MPAPAELADMRAATNSVNVVFNPAQSRQGEPASRRARKLITLSDWRWSSLSAQVSAYLGGCGLKAKQNKCRPEVGILRGAQPAEQGLPPLSLGPVGG